MNKIKSAQVLAVTSLGIRRSERWLFRQLDFQLLSGEILQITGQNGAGKTSLLRCLCGLLPHAEGDINWQVIDEVAISPLFLGHLAAVKPELTVLENLQYHPIGSLFSSDEDIEKAIEEVRLSYYADTPARHLSAGQTRRVGLARLLLSKTSCWILDEPFTSLDLEGCQWLESKMVEFVQQGGSVIFTSHQATSLSIPPRILQLEQPQEWLC